jgi:hypothetical protein
MHQMFFARKGLSLRPAYRLTAEAASISLSLYGRRRTSEGFDLKPPHGTPHLERITRVLVGGGSDAALNPYSIGGSRFSDCPMLEAVRLCEEGAVKESNSDRKGITSGIRSVSKFKPHYPEWEFRYDDGDMLECIHPEATKNVLGFSLGYLAETWSL